MSEVTMFDSFSVIDGYFTFWEKRIKANIIGGRYQWVVHSDGFKHMKKEINRLQMISTWKGKC